MMIQFGVIEVEDLYHLRLYRSACSLFINWMSNVIIGGWPFYVCTLLQKLQNAAWSCVGSWFTQIYQFILKKAYWTYLCCHLPGTGERSNGCRILSWRLWRSLAYADEKENCSRWTSCKGSQWYCLVAFFKNSLMCPWIKWKSFCG